MPLRKSRRQLALTLAITPLFALTARAQTYTWDAGGMSPTSPQDGDGNWNTTTDADWSNGAADVLWPATGSSNIASFGTGAGFGTVTITSPVSANGLQFNTSPSGDYTIAGSGPSGTLTLNDANPTITLTNSANPTISAPIAGTAGFTLTDDGNPGVLTLTAANSYTGPTTLQSSTLAITSDAAVNNGAGGIVFNGGTLQLNDYTSNLNFNNVGGFFTLAVPDSAELAGAITGASFLTYGGPGTLTLIGNNSYQTTYIDGGKLIFGSPASHPSSGGVILFPGGTLGITADSEINPATGLTFANFTQGSGTLEFENYASSLNFDNIPSLTLGAAAGAPSTLLGQISGSNSFTFVGPGTLVLVGNNTFTGGASLQGGTVVLTSDAALNNGIGGPESGVDSFGAIVQFQNYNSSLPFSDQSDTINLAAAAGTPSSLSSTYNESTVNYYGPGTLNLTGPGSLASSTTVYSGTLVFAAAHSQSLLTVANGVGPAAVQFAPSTGAYTQTRILINSGGLLDITNNRVVIDYGQILNDAAPDIVPNLITGFNHGLWNGPGIVSSTAAAGPAGKFAVGYLDGDTAGDTSGGHVAANEFILAYTLAGDAFLQNSVGFDDLVVVAENFAKTGEDWAGGNFNYDPNGSVGFADLVSVAENFGATSGVSQGAAGGGLSPAWQMASAQVQTTAVVPEPCGMAAALAGAALLRRRRRC